MKEFRVEQVKRIMRQFQRDTFTTELRPNMARFTMDDVRFAENAGYIQKHPGIVGSHSSYYRTAKGMAFWLEMRPNTGD
jgi:hypothetical protein